MTSIREAHLPFAIARAERNVLEVQARADFANNPRKREIYGAAAESYRAEVRALKAEQAANEEAASLTPLTRQELRALEVGECFNGSCASVSDVVGPGSSSTFRRHLKEAVEMGVIDNVGERHVEDGLPGQVEQLWLACDEYMAELIARASHHKQGIFSEN